MRRANTGLANGPGGLALAEVISAMGGYSTLPLSVREVNFDLLYYGANPSYSAAINTPAIQAAINAASTIGDGKVVLHRGTYLSATLILPSNVMLIGAGINVTILKLA